MSKFANTFLKSLNEEKEGGNALTGLLHKDRDASGKATKKTDTLPNGKKIRIKSGKPVDEEKEGNAFTGFLHKTKEGQKGKVGDEEVINTTGTIAEKKHMTSAQKAKRHMLNKKLPTNAFTSEYGKKKGKEIKFATATKMALKENAYGTAPLGMEAAPADAPEPTDVDMTSEPDDSEVWKKSLDKGTNPADFDVADNPQITIDASGIRAATEWIKKLEEMASFINATGPESLNQQINQLEMKNSVPFRGIVRREEKRITKLAENLRGLAEVFKSVVITSEKKIKDVNSPR